MILLVACCVVSFVAGVLATAYAWMRCDRTVERPGYLPPYENVVLADKPTGYWTLRDKS